MDREAILEIGPAKGRDRTFPGSITLDCDQHGDIVSHWGIGKLPFDDGAFGLVYASHVLEHIPWYRVDFALMEAHRVLRPGGAIEVWVPDFSIIVREWLSGKFPAEDWTPHNPERDPMKWIAGRLFCGKDGTESDWHRSCFDASYLGRALRKAGFAKVERLKHPPAFQAINHSFINLGMRGTK